VFLSSSLLGKNVELILCGARRALSEPLLVDENSIETFYY
jgi:hypothetical protein